MYSYHFVGVGGSGMSALAQVLAARGNRVSGSDRNYDLGVNLPLFDWLSSCGIQLFPQDGSGVKSGSDLDAAVKTDSGARVRSDLDAGVKPDSGARLRSDSDAGVKPDSGARLRSDSGAGVKQDAGAGLRSGSGAAVKTDSGAGLRSGSDLDAGSGLDVLVVSTAIEESIPDVARARQLNIPIRKRADVLAELLNESYGIAVAGTSGKTTVTGMIGHVLTHAGLDPTIINGGGMKNFPLDGRPNNMRIGSSKVIVAESDESDGSIVNYHPALSIITNISKDHKDIPELQKLFLTFANQTKEKVVINGDCPNISCIESGPRPDYYLFPEKRFCSYKAASLHLEPFGSTFECQGQLFHLQVPGPHNIYNALATIAIASQLGIPMASIQEGLDSFQGISRRFDLVGEVCVGDARTAGAQITDGQDRRCRTGDAQTGDGQTGDAMIADGHDRRWPDRGCPDRGYLMPGMAMPERCSVSG